MHNIVGTNIKKVTTTDKSTQTDGIFVDYEGHCFHHKSHCCIKERRKEKEYDPYEYQRTCFDESEIPRKSTLKTKNNLQSNISRSQNNVFTKDLSRSRFLIGYNGTMKQCQLPVAGKRNSRSMTDVRQIETSVDSSNESIIGDNKSVAFTPIPFPSYKRNESDLVLRREQPVWTRQRQDLQNEIQPVQHRQKLSFFPQTDRINDVLLNPTFLQNNLWIRTDTNIQLSSRKNRFINGIRRAFKFSSNEHVPNTPSSRRLRRQ